MSEHQLRKGPTEFKINDTYIELDEDGEGVTVRGTCKKSIELAANYLYYEGFISDDSVVRVEHIVEE